MTGLVSESDTRPFNISGMFNRYTPKEIMLYAYDKNNYRNHTQGVELVEFTKVLYIEGKY